MSNIKNINQIPKAVYDSFEKDDHAFLVKAIQRDQQGNFKNLSFHVGSMDEVYINIAPDYIVRHKVFSIGEKIVEVEGVTKMKAKEFVEMKAKEARLAQYNQLKKEFENQPVPAEVLN